MLSFINAKANANVNDLQDRTNVAGMHKLSLAGLLRRLRLDAIRTLDGSAYVRSRESAYLLAHQGAVRAVEFRISAAVQPHRTWRPEQPARLLAFACTS